MFTPFVFKEDRVDLSVTKTFAFLCMIVVLFASFLYCLHQTNEDI